MTAEKMTDVFESVLAGTCLFWPIILAGSVLIFADIAWQRAVGVLLLLWVARMCARFYAKCVEKEDCGGDGG